jgi:DNA-binding GntR family transcriptional regulator
MTTTAAAGSTGRPLLRSYAHDRLRERIMDGELAPGEPISEVALAASLKISRTPVREALQALAHEGLVEVYPKRGTFVARLTDSDAREAFELRDAIETAAARHAARRRTAAQLRTMEAAFQGRGPGSAYDQAADFHRLVVEASHNRYLLDAFLTVKSRIELASRMASRLDGTAPATHDHEPIYRAIASGDPDAAESAMRKHIEARLARALDQLG